MNQAQIAQAAAMLKSLGINLDAPRKAKGRKGQKTAGVKRSEDEINANVIAAFTKAGYKDVQPRVNVKVYGKEARDGKPATGWLAEGRRVKAKQKAVYVGTLPLFHYDQTEVDTASMPADVVQPNTEAPASVQ